MSLLLTKHHKQRTRVIYSFRREDEGVGRRNENSHGQEQGLSVTKSSARAIILKELPAISLLVFHRCIFKDHEA